MMEKHERLQQQIAFLMEIDKVKIYSGRPILPMVREKKMMLNTPGTLR